MIDEVEEKPTVETTEALRLKLHFQCEERQLARVEAQRARDAEKALQDAQFAEAREAREETKRARESAEAEAQKARVKTG